MFIKFQRKIRFVGIVVALAFAVNLLAVIPNQAQAVAENAEHTNNHIQINSEKTHPVEKAHDHVKMCGLHTCNFKVESVYSVIPLIHMAITVFHVQSPDFVGLVAAPPKEPPKA